MNIHHNQYRHGYNYSRHLNTNNISNINNYSYHKQKQHSYDSQQQQSPQLLSSYSINVNKEIIEYYNEMGLTKQTIDILLYKKFDTKKRFFRMKEEELNDMKIKLGEKNEIKFQINKYNNKDKKKKKRKREKIILNNNKNNKKRKLNSNFDNYGNYDNDKSYQSNEPFTYNNNNINNNNPVKINSVKIQKVYDNDKTDLILFLAYRWLQKNNI